MLCCLTSVVCQRSKNVNKYKNNAGKIQRVPEKSYFLCHEIINLFTKKDDLVVELFCGTAPLGHCCLMSGRKYVGIDNDKKVGKGSPGFIIMISLLSSVYVTNGSPGYIGTVFTLLFGT